MVLLFASRRPLRRSILLPWLAATLWIAVLFNLPTLWHRCQGVWAQAPGVWRWLGPLAELALLGGVTGGLLALGQLGGRWLLRPLATLLLLASAVCAYYMARYQVVIGVGVLSATLTTDHDLSGEIIGLWLLLWILVLGVLPAVWFWRQARTPGLARGLRRADWWQALILMAAVSAGLMTLGYQGLHGASRQMRGNAGPETNLVGVATHAYVPSNWLSGSAMVVAARVRQAQDDAQLVHPGMLHHYQPAAQLDDAVVLLVIGETTRADRLGVLGHSRDTTPHLSADPHVAAFAGWSCDTSTQLSLACMFVRPQGVIAGKPDEPDRIVEDNVFAVFKQLGFRIDLYAMQSEAGFYTRVRPDDMKIREILAAQPENSTRRLDDRLLLPEVDGALQRHAPGSGPQLIVLHTKGSHALYSQRYPREFARWTPECLSTDQFCNQAELLNAFDNSVLFIDEVLHQLRQQVADRKVLMVWVSDHGESIDDNSHFHATPRHQAPPEQRRVPLVFWASPNWRADPELGARYTRLQARARAARSLPPDSTTYGHHNLYASLLGCAGISAPEPEALPEERNLCR